MKTLPLSLTQETLEKLFQDGICLTFRPFGATYFKSIMEKEHDYKIKYNIKFTWHLYKLATIPLEWPSFVFFSNGVLIPRFSPTKDYSLKLEKIKRALSLHGYKITKIFEPAQDEIPDFTEFLKKIEEYAFTQYPAEKNLEIIPLPDKDSFVKDCFKNGNILLTASKFEQIDPSCRQYLALFEDGSFFVSNDYEGGNSINDPSMTYDFGTKYNQYVYFKRKYVPQDYLEALYEKAKTFDWYISYDEALKNLPPQENLTNGEKLQMRDYIKTLLKNRKCISVTLPPSTAPYVHHVEPRHDWYVLFDDGKLILSKDRHEITNKAQIETLQLSYPDMKFNVEYVPEHYISAIYEEVSKIQKTAKDIYLEILKQKARGLKKMLKIPHHEALELSARIVGFKSWKSALLINERNARYAIEREQEKKKYALEKGKDPLEREYKKYLDTNS